MVLSFIFTNPSTTHISTLSLHDALPISVLQIWTRLTEKIMFLYGSSFVEKLRGVGSCLHRSEEHTSELQSHHDLVCRLLLEKKNKSKLVSGSLGYTA